MPQMPFRAVRAGLSDVAMQDLTLIFLAFASPLPVVRRGSLRPAIVHQDRLFGQADATQERYELRVGAEAIILAGAWPESPERSRK